MKIGEMLLRAGVINELQLNAALAEQRQWGGKLGQILVRMGALSEELLVMALARQLALPRADLSKIQAVPDVLRERLDLALCQKLKVIPLAYISDRKSAQIAMADPFDLRALDELRMRLQLKIEPFIAGEQAILETLRRTYVAQSASAMSFGGELEMMDNGGRRLQVTTPSPRPRPSMPPQAPQASMPPQMQAAAGQASLNERVSEHARTVAVVARLLAEKGLTPRR